MDVLDILGEIKEDIGGQLVTDETLREWANQLTGAIYESEDIAQEAGDTIKALMHECKQANLRAGANHNAIHNKILFGRYFNLLRFVFDCLNIENREEVFGHCRNVINGTDKQEPQQEEAITRRARPNEREPKKRGRVSKPFSSVIVGNETEILHKLHGLLEGKTGCKAVIFIKAAILLGLIQKPTYTQFKEEFGEIASKPLYNKYIGQNLFSEDEINGAKQALSL